jgi:peroxiredoxin
MSEGLTPGAVLPDFQLPDDTGMPRRLSDLQGDDAMVLMLGRGEHCPPERQHQRVVRFSEWCPVAFTQLVTVLPNDLPDTNKMRIATGAFRPYLSDGELEVQRTLDIREYTDPHHAATVPHTLVVAPGRVIEKVHVGYWFWADPPPTSCGRTSRRSSAASMPTSTGRPPRCARPGWPLCRAVSGPGGARPAPDVRHCR